MSTPERINPRYRDALLEARDRSFAINRQGAQQLMAAYAEILVRLGEDIPTGRISAERANRMRREVLGAMARFEARMVELTQHGMRTTARDVERIHREVVRGLMGEAGLVAPDFDRVAERALGAMASRGESAAAFETLARRKLQRVARQLDTMLNAAVARGVDAATGTVDVARVLAGDNPRLVEAVRRLGGDQRFVTRLQVGIGGIDLERYGIPETQVGELRTLFYDARRIQVSEVNNAFREANAESLVESPIVTAVHWQVSSRHDFGNPDECSVLATADYYGLGEGMYPPEKFPLAPHPHCQCHQAGPIKFRPPAEWGRPRPAPPALRRRPDDPAALRQFAGKWTENRQERVAALLRGTLTEAEQLAAQRAQRAG